MMQAAAAQMASATMPAVEHSEFEAAVQAHMRHYIQLSSEQSAFMSGDPEQQGRRQLQAVMLLTCEAENIVEALDTAANRRELEWLRSLGSGVTKAFAVTSKNSLLLHIASRIQEVAAESGASELANIAHVMRLRVLRESGQHQDLLIKARELLDQRHSFSPSELVSLLVGLAIGETQSGTLEAAQQALIEALGICQANQLSNQALQCQLQLGIASMHAGNLSSAQELMLASAAGFEACGDLLGLAGSRSNLAIVQMRLAEFEKARHNFEATLPLRRELGDKRAEAVALANLGSLLGEIGEIESARKTMQDAIAVMQEVGNVYAAACITGNLGMLNMAEGMHNEARESLQLALNSHLQHEHHAAALETLRFLAHNALKAGQSDECREWLEQWVSAEGLTGMRREIAAGAVVTAGWLHAIGRCEDVLRVAHVVDQLDQAEPLALEQDLSELLCELKSGCDSNALSQGARPVLISRSTNESELIGMIRTNLVLSTVMTMQA